MKAIMRAERVLFHEGGGAVANDFMSNFYVVSL